MGDGRYRRTRKQRAKGAWVEAGLRLMTSWSLPWRRWINERQRRVASRLSPGRSSLHTHVYDTPARRQALRPPACVLGSPQPAHRSSSGPGGVWEQRLKQRARTVRRVPRSRARGVLWADADSPASAAAAVLRPSLTVCGPGGNEPGTVAVRLCGDLGGVYHLGRERGDGVGGRAGKDVEDEEGVV